MAAEAEIFFGASCHLEKGVSGQICHLPDSVIAGQPESGAMLFVAVDAFARLAGGSGGWRSAGPNHCRAGAVSACVVCG